MVDVAQLEEELARVLSTSPRDAVADAEVLQRAVAACRADPKARDSFDLPGLFDELAEVYQQLGRVEDALAAMQAAIDAGYAGSPDPRCRLAEILLRAGRTEPAAQAYAQVKADTPDDVWLYNSAGLEYAAAGNPQQALDWFTQGLQLALDTGDPENLVAQLQALRREQLNDLAHQHDELDARAETFLTERRSQLSPRPLTVRTTCHAGHPGHGRQLGAGPDRCCAIRRSISDRCIAAVHAGGQLVSGRSVRPGPAHLA